MEYFILVVVALALWHWFYEAILAPSMRLAMRFRLFKLRDELRMLKIKHGRALDDKHFHHLQDSLNNAIRLLPRLDMLMLFKMAHRLQHDAEFRARVETRSKTLDDCKLGEAMEIRKRTIELVEHIFTVNSGAWVLYLVPGVLAIICYQSMRRVVKSFTALSEADIQKVAPDSAVTAVPA